MVDSSDWSESASETNSNQPRHLEQWNLFFTISFSSKPFQQSFTLLLVQASTGRAQPTGARRDVCSRGSFTVGDGVFPLPVGVTRVLFGSSAAVLVTVCESQITGDSGGTCEQCAVGVVDPSIGGMCNSATVDS